MPRQKSPAPFPRSRCALLLVLWALSGAAVLLTFSTLQKIYLGIALHDLRSYLAPFFFGGTGGLLLGLYQLKLRRFNCELTENESRYRNLYQNTPVMLHSINRQGQLVSASRHWLETLGYSESEVLGRKLTDFFSESSRHFAESSALPDFFRNGFVRDIPYQMVKKSGETIDVLLSAVAERDERGEFVRSLAVAVDVTERKRAESAAHRLAYYDPLTGLPNRVLFQDRLGQSLAQAHRSGGRVALLYLDLDRFKGINDTLGHSFGDLVLREVAGRLGGCLREGDTLARLGGDEFVLLLTGDQGDLALGGFAKCILNAFTHSLVIQEREVFTAASIGIALYPEDGSDPETLLRNADIAMYAAKSSGRNTYQFFSEEMNAAAVEKLSLETHLRRALERGELSLAYQPQVDLRSGEITGLETLLRWNRPGVGAIPPDRFVPVAEETGLILPIGEWALRTACAQGRAWQDAGYPPLRIAVNLSASQIKQPRFIDLIDRVLEETGLDPHRLEIELTESTIMENAPDTIMAMTDLKVRGIQLAIDDFGTGYSSLTYLKHFPINRIKIAQEFVRDIPSDPDDAAIVEAIIAMAHSLDLNVIAEGVEKREQLEFLRARRCHEMQGFYFAQPLRAWEVTRLFTEGKIQPGVCLFGEGGTDPARQ